MPYSTDSADNTDNTFAFAWVFNLNPPAFRDPKSSLTFSLLSYIFNPSLSKTLLGKRKKSNNKSNEN